MSVQAVLGPLSPKEEWEGNESITELSNAAINPRTSESPAVANFADSLIVTYRGAGDTDLIFQSLYNNGTWSQDQAIKVSGGNIGTSAGPSLAVFKGTLYMAYRSSAKIDGEYPIMLATLPAGQTSYTAWQGDKPISINSENLATDHAPSLTVQGSGDSERLWLGWQKDSDLFTATFDGSTWTNNGQIKDVSSNGTPQSNYQPAICGYGSSVWVIFKGRHSDHLMWAAYNVVTKLWTGNLDIEDKRGIMDKPKSDRPPGIAVFEDSMYITYKGDSGDDYDIRQAMLTDQVWSGNKPIYDSSDISPTTDQPPSMATSAISTKGKPGTALIMVNKSTGDTDAGNQIYVSELM